MFQKSDVNSGNRYDQTNRAGTNYLRHTVLANIYSGDERISDKLTSAQLYWNFYNNKHWAKNNDELLSFNYVRAIIDKVNNFMIGKEGFELNVIDSFGDSIPEELEKAFEMFGNFVFGGKRSKKKYMQDIMQMGAITGDAYVFLEVTAKGVVPKLLDSRTTVPKFEKGNSNTIESYRVIMQLGKNKDEYIQKVTEYTKLAVISYYLKKTGDDAQKFEYKSEPNTLGEIPIVHIRNLPKSDSYGGRSDIEDIVKINKTFNEMAVDYKMIVDYYAQPTTIITGGTVGNLTRGIGSIWSGLPSEAQVFNLTLNEDMGATTNFLKMLKESMHDLTGVPEEVLSKVQHISNTSAAALHMMYQPMIQVSDNKSIGYASGISDIIKMAGLMYDKYKKDHPIYTKLIKATKLDDSVDYADRMEVFFDRFYVDVVFKYNLPNDRLSALNEITIEIANGIASKQEVMERLGKQNIPKIMSEIALDVDKKVEIETKMAALKAKVELPKVQETPKNSGEATE